MAARVLTARRTPRARAQQPQIILLREGTDTSQGKAQLIANINACAAVVEAVRTTLGPRGMDKLIHDGTRVTISNDGATIMKLLEIVHPAAKTLVDIAKSQDDEVGDGTTTVVLLAGSFLDAAKSFVEDGVHPQIIVRVRARARVRARSAWACHSRRRARARAGFSHRCAAGGARAARYCACRGRRAAALAS